MCYSNMVVCICFCNASVFHDDINIHAHCFRYHRLPRQKKQPPPRSEQFRFLFTGSSTDFSYAFINPFVYHFFGIFQLIWTPFCSLLPPVIFPWPFPRWCLIHRLRRCWTMARCCLAFHSCLAVGKVSNGADVAGLARNLHEMGKKMEWTLGNFEEEIQPLWKLWGFMWYFKGAHVKEQVNYNELISWHCLLSKLCFVCRFYTSSISVHWFLFEIGFDIELWHLNVRTRT